MFVTRWLVWIFFFFFFSFFFFFFPRTRLRGNEEKARGRRKDLGRKNTRKRDLHGNTCDSKIRSKFCQNLRKFARIRSKFCNLRISHHSLEYSAKIREMLIKIGANLCAKFDEKRLEIATFCKIKFSAKSEKVSRNFA